MFSSIGLPEILIILVAVLILFGGRKLPQLARDLGTGIREFKRSLTNAKNDLELEDGMDLIEGEAVAKRNPAKTRKSPKNAKKKIARRRKA